MPVPGTKPKPEGQRRRRNAPVIEWAEVANVPFAGVVPVELPDGLLQETRDWWSVVSALPHCGLWSAGDWRFARDSSLVADAFYRDPAKNEKALRDREKLIGMTFDSRRDLRIRYVEPTEVVPTEVASIDDYRRAATVHQSATDEA